MCLDFGRKARNAGPVSILGSYTITGVDQELIFSPNAIEYMRMQRQSKIWQAEAGGQLFAKVTPCEIFVVEATGPRATDVRTRTTYRPDRRAEQEEIHDRFKRGLVYVGDWHTHPDKLPSPSARDAHSMVECFSKSRHNLRAFILVIVGSGSDWLDSFVALYSGKGVLQMLQGRGAKE